MENFDELLTAARQGNKEAQGRLLEACRRPLLRLARRELDPLLVAKGGASDVVQETFLKALREIDSFRGCTPEQLLAWLRVILERTASNFRRHFHTSKRDAAREVSGKAAPIQEDLRCTVPSASDKAIRNEQDRLVRQVLERLPGEFTEVVRLRYYEGRSFEEIGHRLGCTGEAARKLWMRAVAQVGQQMAGL